LTGLLDRFGNRLTGPLGQLADQDLDLIAETLCLGVEDARALVGAALDFAEQVVAFDVEPLGRFGREGVNERLLLVRSELEGDGLGLCHVVF